MDNNSSEIKNELLETEKEIKKWKSGLILAGFLLIFFYTLAFVELKDFPASLNPERWGQFGDFIGGLLNPMVAFAAFYWLTVSVHTQKREMAAARLAMEQGADAQRKLVVQGERSTKIAAFTASIGALSGRLSTVNARINSIDHSLMELFKSSLPGGKIIENMSAERGQLIADAKKLEDQLESLTKALTELTGESSQE